MAFITTNTTEASNMEHIEAILDLIALRPSRDDQRKLLENIYRLGVIDGNLQAIREMRSTRESEMAAL
jgi:hypothetical protein